VLNFHLLVSGLGSTARREANTQSVDEPRYIETLARRGYRWKAPVEWVGDTSLRDVSPGKALANNGSFGFSLIGKKVSHYRVLEVLGGGGMGVVFEAEDTKLGRRVAIKFLPEELAGNSKALERFEREARAASALDHPNICSIYEFGEHESQPFIVMQLLEGQTLRERIGVDSQHAKPFSTLELLEFAIQIARGLEAAHQKGIIHRDIKPANIFITDRGEAKILDFGVAKLATERVESNVAITSGLLRVAPLDELEPPTVLSLTLTGANVGTASYMSPEQIRGEKLDARSDLFSFGLVLHEMATGQHAFSAETAELVRVAILHRPVQPVRQIDPDLPAELERIITRSLERNCETRYQHASEIRADLESLRERTRPQRPFRWQLQALGGAAALLIASAVLWFGSLRPPSRQTPVEPKLRQLTTNSFENRVLSGAISPDGKYLAYSDAKGMRVQLVATGETRVVPQPKELEGKEVNWEVVGTWFPDSSRFVVNSHPMPEDISEWSSRTSGVWLVSVLDGPPHKLRDNAVAYSISPDGSSIAFGTNTGRLGDREIWLMGSNGENARKIFDTDEDSSIDGLLWSRDGKRVLYYRTDQSGVILVSRDLSGGSPVKVLGGPEIDRVRAVLWRADGRILYSAEEPGSYIGGACNLWEMRLDSKTGSPVEKPKKLTNWTGFCMGALSESTDGKQLSFLKWSGKQTSFLAELGGGNHILHLRHFPLSESSEGVVGWTFDSKEVIFISTRSGHGIYRQSLDKEIAEPVLPQGLDRDPLVAPDGNSILYLAPGKSGGWPAEEPQPVMRISISGGQPQPLFTAHAKSVLSCARAPSSLCLIAEPSEKAEQLIISSIDLEKGRGPELFRFPLAATNRNWFFELSPDGTRIAIIRNTAGPIYILTLTGQTKQQVQVKGWGNLEAINWTADGNGLFVTAHTANGREILNVDFHGNAYALWENTGGSGETFTAPSPDGRYLSFNGWTMSGNMWMME
jgi:serine/threonine protein kinase